MIDIKRHGLSRRPNLLRRRDRIRGAACAIFPPTRGLRITARIASILFINCSTPNTYFGWLSIVPRVGFRGTYYSETRDLGKTIFPPNPDPLVPDFLPPPATLARALSTRGFAIPRGFRCRYVEASFKISRNGKTSRPRVLGLDGLRHIIQPFTDFLCVSDSGNPGEILQFDQCSTFHET